MKAFFALLAFAALAFPAAHAREAPTPESGAVALETAPGEAASAPSRPEARPPAPQPDASQTHGAQPNEAAPPFEPVAPKTAAPASTPIHAPPKPVPTHATPAKRPSHEVHRQAAPVQRAQPPSRSTSRKHRAKAPEKRSAIQNPADERQNRNPVIEAINLVASTQQEEIKAADKKISESDWWSDTLDREWIVKRPFGPGIFDSTHWFYVSYKVNGRILMSWFVDLNKGTVSDVSPPERHSAR